jgi:hypothetical protein
MKKISTEEAELQDFFNEKYRVYIIDRQRTKQPIKLEVAQDKIHQEIYREKITFDNDTIKTTI